MVRLRHYRIQYCFNGQPRSFAQKDSRMSSADAWYYAALHSGADRLQGVTLLNGSARELRLHAQLFGITEVGYQELP